MSPLLLLAAAVALSGFVLLLKPELLWKRVQRDRKLTGPYAALLRLVGIAVLALSVLIAQQVK